MINNIIYQNNLKDLYSNILLIKNYSEIEEINSRFEKSLDYDNFYPLEYLIEKFNLNYFEKITVRLIFLNHIKGIENHTKAFAIDEILNLLKFDDKIQGLNNFGNDLILKKIFFKYNNDISLDNTLNFKDRIGEFLFEDSLISRKIKEIGEIYFPEDIDDFDTQFNDKTITINKIKDIYGEDNACFIKSDDISETISLLKNYYNSINKPFIIIDTEKISENYNDYFDEIFFEKVLFDADLCFINIDIFAEKNDTDINKIIINICEENCFSFFISKNNINFDYNLIDNICFSEITYPNTTEKNQKTFWQSALKNNNLSLTELEINEISAKFHFNYTNICSIIKYAKMNFNKNQNTISLFKFINDICIKSLPKFNSNKVIKINPIYKLYDLILPKHSKNMINYAINQVKYNDVIYNEWGFSEKVSYGKGVSIVFVGPPGTGKTMGAQVIANELGLMLYKVNLAGIVSKYIGETEKNLDEIFKEAKKSQGILFFDEADVLFSKRTDIKDSNDKYSNMESAFMLQKIEEFDGICILATNLIQNFDEAFKRRMNYIIDFPFPNAEYREMLWKSVFPKKVPLSDDVNFNFLANKFELSGSNIKNSAIMAAFLAVANNTDVDMLIILTAIKNEMNKIGKLISKENLYEYSDLWEKINI